MNVRSILLLSTLLLLTACDVLNDKKSLSGSISDESVKKLASPIKDEIIFPKPKVKPKYNKIQIPTKFYKKVSLTVNESLPLKSVLYEIAKQLKINIQIDPLINSKVIFMADNKPFIEVVDAICDIANLRYTIQNDFLKIVEDLPYSQSYDVPFLNISRDSENKIAIATEVTGSKNNNTKNNNDSYINSDSTVTFKSKSEFWDDLSNGIKIILSSDNNNKYSINKQSGIVTIYANSKCHKDIQSYLDQITEDNNSQVLIEAKIIEVVLNNEYRRGIDWNVLLENSKITTNFVTNFANGRENMLSFHSKTKTSNVNTIIKALEQFGSVRTISNPRITTMNNQAAVIKIAENHVYFKLNYDKIYSSTESSRQDINVSSDIKTIPIGLVMFVQPSIDVKSNTVSLFLRPTITKLQNTVNDPAVDIAIQSINSNNNEYSKSKIPVTEVREVASVLQLNDGEVAVLGGFMEVISAKSKSGLPLVKDVPILGELSSECNAKDKVVELVILVKVKISEPTTLQRAADIRLQRFVPDPRPF